MNKKFLFSVIGLLVLCCANTSYACHPTLSCVEKTQSQIAQKQCVAWFGFVGGENIAYGSSNKIYGGGLSSSYNQGQGTKFSTSNKFGSDSSASGKSLLGVTYDCSSVSWNLNGSIVTANSNSPNCQSTCSGDPFSATFGTGGMNITVSSSKDLSHVVLNYCDGSSFKFDNLSIGSSATFSQNKQIQSATVKAGCTESTFSRQCLKEDCLGVPGGTAVDLGCGCNIAAPTKACDGKLYCSNAPVVDSCGVCGGTGPQKLGCDGKLYCSNAPVVDSCGVCGGTGPQKLGCDGKLYCETPPVNDVCGVCSGNGKSCLDCADVPNGNHVYNSCGVCVDKSTIREKRCSEVNGYLGQINIGTILNLAGVDNTFDVSYYDLSGSKDGVISLTIPPNTKRDFIVNDVLGLKLDTYGTVCVEAVSDLEWKGGVTVYKSSEGQKWEGEYDFAMYYDFSPGQTGVSVVPLNLYHPFGGDSRSVANWIRVTDIPGDCNDTVGVLDVYQSNSVDRHLGSRTVELGNGARTDISGHDIMTTSHAGMAVFTPSGKGRYQLSVGRLIYDCGTENPFGCNRFLTGINIGGVSPSSERRTGSISTFDNTSWVEINNPNDFSVSVTGSVADLIPAHATRHYLPYVGFVGVGLVDIVPSGPLSINVLNYGGTGLISWATKLLSPVSIVQTAEWNSFLGQTVYLDLYNNGVDQKVTYDVFDYSGNHILSGEVVLSGSSGVRTKLDLPPNLYGTVNIMGDDIVSTVLVNKNNEFVLTFLGK